MANCTNHARETAKVRVFFGAFVSRETYSAWKPYNGRVHDLDVNQTWKDALEEAFGFEFAPEMWEVRQQDCPFRPLTEKVRVFIEDYGPFGDRRVSAWAYMMWRGPRYGPGMLIQRVPPPIPLLPQMNTPPQSAHLTVSAPPTTPNSGQSQGHAHTPSQQQQQHYHNHQQPPHPGVGGATTPSPFSPTPNNSGGGRGQRQISSGIQQQQPPEQLRMSDSQSQQNPGVSGIQMQQRQQQSGSMPPNLAISPAPHPQQQSQHQTSPPHQLGEGGGVDPQMLRRYPQRTAYPRDPCFSYEGFPDRLFRDSKISNPRNNWTPPPTPPRCGRRK